MKQQSYQTTHYQEEQKLDQWWVRLFVVIPIIIVLLSFTEDQSSIEGLGIGLVVGIGVPILLLSMKLITKVKNDGIYVRFFPFHQKPKQFLFSEVVSIEGKTYSPIKDYGGWGIKYSKKGWVYSISGNQGVLLTLNSGKQVMIGSKHYRRLESMAQGRMEVYKRDHKIREPKVHPLVSTTKQPKPEPSSQDVLVEVLGYMFGHSNQKNNYDHKTNRSRKN